MKILKKLTSIFLTVTMVTGSIFTSGMSNTAYAAESENVASADATITLPLKIRDAHLDGFIFEHEDSNAFNEIEGVAYQDRWKKATKGLIESTLDMDKKIVYTDGAIGILANNIKDILDSGKAGTSYATYKTLLNALLNQVKKDGNGKYYLENADGTKEKPTKFENITSCYGAAYWMTYYLFRDGGDFAKNSYSGKYTIPYSGYQYLVLNKQRDGSYLFQADKGEADVEYNTGDGLIQNNSTPGVDRGGFFPLNGITTTDGKPVTENTTINGKSYNFGYTLESSGKFVYHKDENLYFDFYGDDDVYLFINNKLALDIGGQHEQVKDSVYLEGKCTVSGHTNETWAEYLQLEEGGIYDFNFFYMERHTTEANMKIHTNIRVYDAEAVPQKNAYVGDTQIPYGGLVAQGTIINYEFVLTNKVSTNQEGAPISNLTFRDDQLGVNLSKTSIVLNNRTGISDEEITDISDLTVVNIDKDGKSTTTNITGIEQLKGILEKGIGVGETIKIKGFKYKLVSEEFVNTLSYTADCQMIDNSTKTLKGTAQNKVKSVPSSDKAFVIDYGKPVKYTYDEVFDKVDGFKSREKVSIKNATGAYGKMTKDDNEEVTTEGTTSKGTITYTLNKFMSGIDTFILEEEIKYNAENNQVATTNLYTNVKMIPATSIYYEDNFTSSGKDNDEITAGIIYGGNVVQLIDGKPVPNGDTINTSSNQDNTNTSKPNDTDDIKGVYGYDSSYSDDLKDSEGSSHQLTSSSSTDIASAYFTFKGTGFDIVGRTSKDSGMIRVDVYNQSMQPVGEPILVINTHKENSNLGDTLYQIPVVKKQGLAYGEYTVLIRVFNSVSGLGVSNSVFYLDGVRIYNPLGTEADEQYVADGEAYPTYTELGDKLVDEKNYDKDGNKTEQVGVFVEGQLAENLEDYKIIGPNNEIYLDGKKVDDENKVKPGQSVGFKIDNYNHTNIASIQIGAKAINGEKAQITVGTGDNTQTIYLTSATDMYYDITDTVRKNNGIVIISSTGNNVASITNLKITHHESPASGEAGGTLKVSLSDEVFNAIKELEESKAQSPVVNSAKFKSSSVKVNNKATIVVETNLEAEEIKVSLNGKNVKLESSKLVQQKDGKKVFNVTIKAPSKAGKYVYEVSALNSDKSIESEKIKTNTLYTSKAQSPVVNSAKFKSSSVKINNKATIVVETNLEAEEIKVSLNGKNVKLESSKLVQQKDGKKVFNVTIKAPSKKGKYVYEVSALNSDKSIESKKIKTNTLDTRSVKR